MAITRINNNQITDSVSGNIYLGVNAAVKLQDYTITAGKIQNNLVYGSDLTVTGNLTVQGNTTAIDTVNLVVEDPLILLAKEQTGSPTLDIGYIGKRGTSENIAFVWDESSGNFVTAYTDSEATNTVINITSYASFLAGNLFSNNALSVSGQTTLTGNLVTGNINVNGQQIVDMGNSLVSNVQYPVANTDAATKEYVDAVSSSGFTIEDDVANTTIVSGGDTLQLLGTANEVSVLITAPDQVTFRLPDDVVIAGNFAANTLNATSNVNASGAVFSGNVTAGNISAGSGIIITTGNIDGANVNATGNVTGGNAVFSGNVTAANFIGNISGNIDAGGANTNIQFNDDDVLAGSAAFTFDKTSNLVTASGNISAGNLVTGGVVDATGNVSGGNITTGGEVTATGNITGGNIDTAGQVVATGNVSGGNITTVGNVDGANVNATSGITAGTTIVATGNITGGNIDTAGQVVATGNVTGGNIITGGEVTATGNVAGGNITTSGNVDGNNVNASADVTALNVIASGNVDASIVNTDSIVGTAISITGTSVDLNISGNLNLSGRYINEVADPVAAQDAATKQYVDDAVSSGIHIHTPVDVETPVALPTATYANGGNTFTVNETVAGNTVVFTTAANLQVNDQLWFDNSFNGVVGNLAYFVVSTPNTSAAVLSTTYNGIPVSNITSGSSLSESVRVNSGIGATLTATANAALVVDGVSVSNGDRILVYQQAVGYENGVYDVTDAGNVSAPWILTRSSDADTYEPQTSTGLDQGSYFYVQSGDTGAGESYVKTAPPGPFIFGVANIVFTQFSASQVYSANTQAGLVLNGTVFSAKVDNDTTAFDGGGNIIVKTGANLVTPNIGNATGNSLTLTGNGLLSAVTVDATGNVLAGNVNSNAAVTAVTVVASGNVDGANVNATSGITAGTTIIATGNVTGGNIDTAGQVVATGNITGGNLLTGGAVTATGNVSGGNITTTGNIDGANVNATGTIIATGNVAGGNITTSGAIDATGNITGGNISAGTGTIITTGNIDGGNINATANVTGNGAVFSGNVTAQNFIGNISGNIDAGGANTNIQFNDDDVLAGSAAFTFDKTSNLVTATGNISAGNLVTLGVVDATGNVSGGNIITAGQVVATGNVSGGNITTVGNVDGANVNATAGITAGTTIVATGNVTGGNIDTLGQVVATGNVTGGNIITTGSADLGNIRISGDDITNFASNIITVNAAGSDIDFRVSGNTLANLLLVDAGTDTVVIGNGNATVGATFKVDTTDSMMPPVGNLAQRPGSPVLGMLRFSTTGDALELYTSTGWEDVGVPTFTVIVADAFVGDGSTLAFTLSANSTTAATVVSINGIVQEPTTAYSVSGTTLTFTEAPAVSDNIDARILTTTTSVTGIQNSSGNAAVEALNTADTVEITGNLLPATSNTYNLGSSSLRWNELWLEGSTIILGNVVIKNTSGNTIGFFGPDGTTPGAIDTNNIDSAGISNGTSSLQVLTSGGNIRANIAGSTVQTITSTGVSITGDLSVTGNATLSGNILGDRVQNGTTSFDIQVQDGNANISVGGVSNVAVFTGTGANITGTLGVTGNVAGGNLTTAGEVTATGNISGGNLNVTGNLVDTGAMSIITGSNGNITLAPNGLGVVVINTDLRNGQANGVGNIGTASAQFNTIFAKATSAQYADLAEMYEADAEYEPGTVLCFGGTREVTVCNQSDCSRVAGVVSTNPSYLMNSGQTGEYVAAVALTGRVPTRVTGTIRKGDLIVSTGDGRGRANNDARAGTVIGKALADFDGADGVIEVVVGRV